MSLTEFMHKVLAADHQEPREDGHARRLRVFLSYAKLDRRHAAALAETLASLDIDVWWDEHLIGGEAFAVSIEDALDGADAVVVLWTANSISREWVRSEATRAHGQHKLVPVTDGGVDLAKLPMPFSGLHTLALTDKAGLASAIRKAAKARSSLIPSAAGPWPSAG